MAPKNLLQRFFDNVNIQDNFHTRRFSERLKWTDQTTFIPHRIFIEDEI